MAGEGGFGSTFRATNRRCGKQAAVKVFHDRHRDECSHEVRIYEYISGEDQMRRFLHIFDSSVDAPMPYLAMPWLPGDSLANYLQPMQKRDAAGTATELAVVLHAVAFQVADALEYLHSLSVVHTDLKPSNLMLDMRCRRVVIVDFNTAERINLPDWKPRHNMLTTLPYRAPELCSGREILDHKVVTPAIDIWSYGITCLETINKGKNPFVPRGGKGRLAGSATAAGRIVEFSKSSSALERLLQTLPKSVGPLQDIHEILRCALARKPDRRKLILLNV